MAEHRERDELAAYALGLLEEPERQRVEAHLRGCAECAAEIAEHRAVADALSQALPNAQAPVEAWQTIAARIRRGATPAAGRRSQPFWRLRWPALPRALQPALVALLVLAVGGLIGWNAFLQTRLANRDTALDSAVSSWQSSPVTVVALVARPGARDAGGRLVMSHDRKEGGLVVSGLPALPDGQSYQIWFVRPDQSRAPASTFGVDSRGQAVFLVAVPQPAQGFDGVAITEEPAGGSPTPTSPDLLAGLIYE